jgi:hypothetical protein
VVDEWFAVAEVEVGSEEGKQQRTRVEKAQKRGAQRDQVRNK